MDRISINNLGSIIGNNEQLSIIINDDQVLTFQNYQIENLNIEMNQPTIDYTSMNDIYKKVFPSGPPVITMNLSIKTYKEILVSENNKKLINKLNNQVNNNYSKFNKETKKFKRSLEF